MRQGPVEPKLFTHVRYNLELDRPGLDALGLPHIPPEDVRQLDSIAHVKELQEVGRAVGAKQVRAEHFAGFPS